MRQIFYNKENVELNFWCPYTKVHMYEDTIMVDNTLTNQRLTICGTQEILSKLWNGLNKGISDDKLENLLKETKDNIKQEDLIFGGMIE